MRGYLLVGLVVASVLGCGSGGGGSSSKRSGSTIGPITSSTTRTPPRTSPPATTSSTTTTTPPAPPVVTPPPATSGSGGTSTQRGLFTRQVTTVPQAGLPAITVDYKVLVPQSYVFDAGKPVPLVISELTPVSYWDQIPEQEGFILVEQQGYRGTGGFTYDYDPLVLAGILDDVEKTWNVDMKRLYLTGFSAGAHWSYTIGLANSQVFAGLGICAGSLGSAASVGVWVPGATVQPNVPRKVFVAIRHGTTDAVVPVNEGRIARDQLRAAGHTVDHMELSLGHTVTTAELQGLWAALKSQRLP
ncbi:MAG: PHB depolymerase family esterase [Planctomycetota bacterium]